MYQHGRFHHPIEITTQLDTVKYARGNDTIRFRVSFAFDDGRVFQTILTIDEKEKSLVRSHLKQIAPNRQGAKTFDIRMDYQYYRQRKNWPEILLPRRVDYLLESWDGHRVEIAIRDIAFEVD
jgi:hypothetical protein